MLSTIHEMIVNKLTLGAIVVDSDWQVVWINDAAKTLFKQPMARCGMAIHAFSVLLHEKGTQWFSQDASHAKQLTLTEPPVMVHFIPGGSEYQHNILILIEDLRRIAQEAQQLKIASLGRFTASMAHELRNPLGVIGHAAQLLNESESLSGDDRHLSDIINKNCQRMNDIIKNILQLSRRTKTETEKIALKPYLENFINEFLQFHHDAVTFKLDVNTTEPYIYFDKSQLTQILVNLCENSVRYGKDHDGNVIVELEASQDDNDELFLCVKDHGTGIPSQAATRLFEPFFTTSRNGIGMGLYISKELCQANHAQLRVDEKNERGACFRINFNKPEELIL